MNSSPPNTSAPPSEAQPRPSLNGHDPHASSPSTPLRSPHTAHNSIAAGLLESHLLPTKALSHDSSSPSPSSPSPSPHPAHNSIASGLLESHLLSTKAPSHDSQSATPTSLSPSPHHQHNEPYPHLVYEDDLLALGFTLPTRTDESLLHLILHPFSAGHEHFHLHHEAHRHGHGHGHGHGHKHGEHMKLQDIIEAATRILVSLQDLTSREYGHLRHLAAGRRDKMRSLGWVVEQRCAEDSESTVEELVWRMERVVRLHSCDFRKENGWEEEERREMEELVEMVVDLGQDYLLWMSRRDDINGG